MPCEAGTYGLKRINSVLYFLIPEYYSKGSDEVADNRDLMDDLGHDAEEIVNVFFSHSIVNFTLIHILTSITKS